MNEIKIRKLEDDDIESLERLYRQFWGEESDPRRMKEMFSKLSGNTDYIFLAAEAGGQIAGSIMGIICNELYGGCRPFLLMEDLVVDPLFRKMGIGRILVEHLEKEAKNRDCYQIIFMTENGRTDTVKFYESIGFDSGRNIGFKRSL